MHCKSCWCSGFMRKNHPSSIYVGGGSLRSTTTVQVKHEGSRRFHCHLQSGSAPIAASIYAPVLCWPLSLIICARTDCKSFNWTRSPRPHLCDKNFMNTVLSEWSTLIIIIIIVVIVVIVIVVVVIKRSHIHLLYRYLSLDGACFSFDN